MIKLNKKAFTLTELLMVVLMIGIISTMVLPKFTRVIDSFRVLEAEQMMRVVRNEQEKRCTLGKKYTTAANKIQAFVRSKTSLNQYITTNFTYTLTGSGMEASSPSKNYTLRMPFYLDGRMCCDECGGFTKNYLTCDELETESFLEIKEKDPCKPS